MNYMIKDRSNHDALDINAFASDLAGLLGGVIDPQEESASVWASILVGELRVHLRAGYGADAFKVEISAYAPQIERQLSHRPGGWPKAKVSADRPIEKIAADVKRRVIEPAAAPLAKAKAQLAEQLGARAQAEASAAALKEAFPVLSVSFKDSQAVQADVYGNKGGCYFSGRMYADGSLYPDRVGSVPADRAQRLLAALFSDIN